MTGGDIQTALTPFHVREQFVEDDSMLPDNVPKLFDLAFVFLKRDLNASCIKCLEEAMPLKKFATAV